MSRVLPIIFNTEMVRANLDNLKTATRRIIKPSYRPDESGFQVFTNMGTKERWVEKIDEEEMSFDPPRYVIPPYQPGDILYVRETWAFISCIKCDRNYLSKGKPLNCYDTQAIEYDDGNSISEGCFFYRADYSGHERITWRPSIHMPKAAARIWLKVTDVRVERLQDITDDDCMREGIQAWTKDGKLYKYYPADQEGDYPDCEWSKCPRNPKEAMEKIWNSTVKKSDIPIYGWNANPWVWVIEFERCEKPEACILKGIAPAEDKRPCIGYQKSQTDDEPCEMCKECRACNGEELE